MSAACPGTNTIAELVCQQLPADRAAHIEAHAADCPTCRHLIGQLARSSIGRLAGSANAVAASRDRSVLLRPGITIGRYEIERLIGAGGMGIVYAAHDPELDRRVALKLLHPELAADPARARVELLAEAQAMAKLRHANVVTVYDAGTHEDQVFVAMELVEGMTLRGWLAEPRAWRDVARKLAAAARGLGAAHALGIVHRDFKPENVLIDARGGVFVTDFGLARPAGLAGDVGGTPRYMVPEQRAGDPSDPSADQYSFGVVLAEALGERSPRWLADVARRAREAKPEHRYPAMDAIAALLERDPARTRRRVLAGVGAACAVAGAAWALAPRGAALVASCPSSEAKLAGVWDLPRRLSVVQHLAAVAPFGPDVARTAARALDTYRDRWARSWNDTCASRERAEQSPALFDLRVACLSRRLHSFGALTSALDTDARALAAKAPALADALDPVAPCDDAAALLRIAPPAPTDAPAVAEIDRLIVVARTERILGKFRETRATLERALAEAERIGYRPSQAEVLDNLGDIDIEVGDYPAAGEKMRKASSLAIAANDDRLAAATLIDLVDVVGYQLGNTAEGRRLADLAQASLERAGNPSTMVVRLLVHKSELLTRDDKPQEALALVDQAIAVADKPDFDDDNELAELLEAKSLALFDLARYDEARAALDRDLAMRAKIVGTHHAEYAGALVQRASLEMVANEWTKAAADLHEAKAIDLATLGPNSPELAYVENHLASLAGELGDWQEALRAHRAATAFLEKQSDPDHPDLVTGHANIGDALCELGRLDEADAELTGAVANGERVLGPDHANVAFARERLGELRLVQKRGRDAIELFTRARDTYTKLFGADNPRVDYATSGLGRAQLAVGDVAAARGTLATTVERLVASRIDPVLLARTRLALADASWRLGDHAAARALAAQIAADLAILPAGADRELRDQATTWQRTH